MRLKAKINILAQTEKGVSKSTGNNWMSKDVILQAMDEEDVEYTSTIACHCRDKDIITQLESCQTGDIIDATISVFSKTWTSKTTGRVTRYNDVVLVDFTLLEPKEF